MQGIDAINPYSGREQPVNRLSVAYPVASWEAGLVFPNADLNAPPPFKNSSAVDLNPKSQATSKPQKPNNHLTETLQDMKSDFIKWTGRIFIGKTADNVLDKALDLPIPATNPLRKQIEGVSKKIYVWAQQHLFPKAVQYETAMGWEFKSKNLRDYQMLQQNPFAVNTAKAAIGENLSGFGKAQVLRNELGSVKAVSNRVWVQGNLETAFKPLQEGKGLFSFIGAGFAGAMAFFGVASKTHAEWVIQQEQEKAGLQDRSTSVLNTGVAFAKEGIVGLAAWEASTIGFRFAQALLYVLPVNPILKTAVQIIAGVGLGTIFSSITERVGRVLTNRLPESY
jgi:hypothetical protein